MKSIKEIVDMQNYSNEYDLIIHQLQEAKNQNIPIDEGLFGAIGGATIGPKVMKAVCKALGIDEKGMLGNLMTSRLVLTAVGAAI